MHYLAFIYAGLEDIVIMNLIKDKKNIQAWRLFSSFETFLKFSGVATFLLDLARFEPTF